MNIVMVCTNDPAGMGIAFTNAFKNEKHSRHPCRLVTTTTRYNFEFEKDMHVPDFWPTDGEAKKESCLDELEHELRRADVFHFHTFADEDTPLGPFTARRFLKGKQVVYHHHGEPLRSRPDHFRDLYERGNAPVIVSTPDLLKYLPKASWVPNLVPIHDSRYVPLSDLDGRQGGPILVAQSPTKMEIKNTDELQEAVRRLKDRKNYNGSLRLDIIRNTPHHQCLEKKRRSHIFFDHLQGYFGVSSLEALSQGVPTIANLDARVTSYVKEFTGADHLPWHPADSSVALERVLESLVEDAEFRQQSSKESRAFMERSWSEPRVLATLEEVYRTL